MPSDHPDAEHDDDETGTSGQARLDGIPDVIKMPKRTAPTSLIDDGRSWMTEEILKDLIARAEFPNSLEFRIPELLERPYDAPPGWVCVYECMFTEFEMNFSLSPLLLRFAAERDVPTSLLTHGVVRHIVFTEALTRAAGVTFDRLLFEHVTDLRTGSTWKRDFKWFHTTMKHDIVFRDYRSKIHWWKNYFFFVKISRASVGKIKADQIRTEWVTSPGPSKRTKPSSELKKKFKLLKELSHELWPEVTAVLEKKRQERRKEQACCFRDPDI
ncbi:unnamed protein product [Microthlaspi erraticum]|uniref:Uncharacterized protein n=1 Tax=Microthlaspi erraticum TaxID=1685480 RepID=A0A6D2IF49_9BRAS|nr:unnamed protein product [Microthlaspi erraticum]